ncbi:hypothetical protein C8Q75DRAFT_772491 [Abortiporus biennis]|nr:hypothetical protein C8Q75DRAFT_772491 [Abortiporus biennis]
MFVLEALLLTFMTTPAVVLLYPPAMRVRVAAKAVHFDTLLNEEPTSLVHEGEDDGEDKPSHRSVQDELERKERFLVVLDRIEHLPGIMALTQLIQPPSQLDFEFCSGLHCRATTTSSASSSSGPSHSKHRHHRHTSHPQKHSQHHGVSSIPFMPYHDSQLSFSALRLIEITDRTSAVMKYSSLATENLRHTDPLLSIFRTFVELGSGGGGSVELSSEVKMAAYNDLVSNIKDEAEKKSTQMVLIPWLSSTSASYSSIHYHHSGEGGAQDLSSGSSMSSNPFETLFRSAGSDEVDQASGFPFGDSSTSALHCRFIRSVFGSCGSDMDIALYIDQESTTSPHARRLGGNYHLFLPFFGGPDDRLALEFVVQLCSQNPRINATVVRVSKQDDIGEDEDSKRPVNRRLDPRPDDGERHMRDGLLTAQSTTYGTFPDDTVYSGNTNTQIRLQSEMADNILWTRYTTQNSDPIPRITFDDLSTPTPLRSMIQQIHIHLPRPQPHSRPAGPSGKARLLVICGRSRRLAVESHDKELKVIMDEHKSSTFGGLVSKTAGDTAAAVILSGIRVDLVVLQAASRNLT